MKVILAAAFVFVSVGSVFGQQLLPVVKQVAPDGYPAAARAVRATGRVGVSVSVDAEGKVISAEAFSGHPLLKSSAVAAAKNWIFEISEDQTAHRNFTLFFDFKGSLEDRLIDESDKEYSLMVKLSSVSPFEVDLLGEGLIPRFLRLPRKDGKLAIEYCHLHNEELSVEVQSVDCSGRNELHEADVKYWSDESYKGAEETQFPKANLFFGCSSNGMERVETRFCTKCRLARQDWVIRQGD